MTRTMFNKAKTVDRGFQDIFDNYPDAVEVLKIKENGAEFYEQIGYEIFRDGSRVLAIKTN